MVQVLQLLPFRLHCNRNNMKQKQSVFLFAGCTTTHQEDTLEYSSKLQRFWWLGCLHLHFPMVSGINPEIHLDPWCQNTRLDSYGVFTPIYKPQTTQSSWNKVHRSTCKEILAENMRLHCIKFLGWGENTPRQLNPWKRRSFLQIIVISFREKSWGLEIAPIGTSATSSFKISAVSTQEFQASSSSLHLSSALLSVGWAPERGPHGIYILQNDPVV